MQDPKSLTIDIISYDCGWGCRDYGCQDGPAAANLDHAVAPLRDNNISTILSDLKLRALDDRASYTTKQETYPMTTTSVQKLATRCYSDTKNNVMPVVIGGDHSSAIGTWAGITGALGAEGNLGLIWIDAHMDAHTPETADEGKWGGWWHGMPLACITGQGMPEFTNLINSTPKVKPEHIVLIGIRSFEPGEEAYIKDNNIKCYMADEVAEHGFQAIYEDAMKYILSHCDYFGVSIDLDGFDPDDAPGVGTPEKNGVGADQAVQTFKGLFRHPQLKGLEIVEYNPHNDKDKKTAKLIHKLLLSFSAIDD